MDLVLLLFATAAASRPRLKREPSAISGARVLIAIPRGGVKAAVHAAFARPFAWRARSQWGAGILWPVDPCPNHRDHHKASNSTL